MGKGDDKGGEKGGAGKPAEPGYESRGSAFRCAHPTCNREPTRQCFSCEAHLCATHGDSSHDPWNHDHQPSKHWEHLEPAM
jgi:hypothetical protein